jgi:hypothetical protein
MTRPLIVIATALLFASCGRGPKIDYKDTIDTTSVVDKRINDTTKVLVSDLPVQFDSTHIKLFTVGLIDLDDRGGLSKLNSDSYRSSNMPSSYFSDDHISGNFINVVFQEPDGKQRKLTDRKLQIRNISFLRDIFKVTKTGWLLYSVSDRDSNGDKELDRSDVESLYISKIDGREFKKITKELHQSHDWNFIKGGKQVFFRTLEDKNKDGEFNNKDKFHYYYLDFSNGQYSVTEYNPLKIFE